MCTLLVALAPLAAWGAEPETGADESGHAFIVRDVTGERLELAAQLVFDHRPNATASGAPRTAAGALEVGRDGDADHRRRGVRRRAQARAHRRGDGGADVRRLLATADVGARGGARRGAAGRRGHGVRARPRAGGGAAAGGARAVRSQVDRGQARRRRLHAGRRRRRRRGDRCKTRRRARRACASSSRRPRRGRSCTTRPAATSGARPTRTWAWPARLRTVDEHVHARRAVDPRRGADGGQGQVPRRAARGVRDHRSRRPDDGAHVRGAGVRAQRQADARRRACSAHQLRITKSLFAHGTDRPQLESPEVVRARRSAVRGRLGDRAPLGHAQARRAAGDDGGARHVRALAGAHLDRPSARDQLRGVRRSGVSLEREVRDRRSVGGARVRLRVGRGRSRAGAAQPACARITWGSARRRCGRSDGSTWAGRRGCGCSARSGRSSRPSTSTTCTRRRRSTGSSASAGCTSRTRTSRPITRRTPSSA